MKHRTLITALLLAVAAAPAWADSSNGDMSDRGGESFEQLAGVSWGQYDASDAAMFEHFFGPGWRCSMLGQGCREQLLQIPAPTAPIPEPAAWQMALAGRAAVLLLLRRRSAS